MAVPWWNECTNRKVPRCDWSYGLTGSSIEIQGGPLASVRAAITTARIRVCMATSRYGLPVGCRRGQEGLGLREPVHRAVPREHVQLAGGVLPERQHVPEVDLDSPARPAGDGAARVREAADPPRAVIRVEILAAERGRGGAAIHQPADDRAAVRVGVLDRRQHPRSRAPAWRLVAVRCFHGRPSVVDAGLTRGLHVHLLPQVLAHIGDVEEPVWRVEAEAPRVPQADGPDFPAPAARRKRVVRRYPVRVPCVDVDAQQLAEQRVAVLSTVLGVPARASVAHPDVQLPIGPEDHQPAIVIRVGLFDEQDQLVGRAVRHVRIRRHRVALDTRVAVQVGVIDVEKPVRTVARVEGHAEQPLLAAETDFARDVQKRRRQELHVLNHSDPPGLLDHEQAVDVARRCAEIDRGRQTGRDRDELQRVAGGRGAAARRRLPAGDERESAGLCGDQSSDGHLASREILPLKLRTVTWAPPGPVEKRNAPPPPPRPRSATSAVRRFVMDPPMLSRSKSATVVAGTRSATAPLWLSTSTMPPRPSSPSNRTSPVTDSKCPRCTPVPPRCHPAARTTIVPLSVDAPRSTLAPRNRISPLTVCTRARPLPPASSTDPPIVSAVTSAGVPTT